MHVCTCTCMHAGAHVFSKFWKSAHGQAECWHFELVSSETVSELWTKRYPPQTKQEQENSAQNGSSRFCAVLLVAAQNRRQARPVDAVAKSLESLAQARFPKKAALNRQVAASTQVS